MNPATADSFRAPARIFWVGFAVRVLYVTLAHTYRIRPAEDHFQFGWEAGRIARALVTGYGYADPFSNFYIAHTGPTAWLPPLYPLLLAVIFKVFGIYTTASAWVLFVVQSAYSAATALAVWEIAARILNRRVALWSAWIWALYPAAMQYAVRWPWEMTITTALFTFVLALSLRMRGVGCQLQVAGCQLEGRVDVCSQPATSNLQPATSWLLFGLLWALIALSNPTLLIFLPICGLWILLPQLGFQPTTSSLELPGAPSKLRLGGIARTLIGPLLASLVFLAILAPWTLRNHRVFDAFIPLRGNFGAELYLGNGPGSTGFLMEYYHPFQDPQQLHDYATLGEVRYVARQGALARADIAARPAHFVADVLRRIYFFWFGVPHPFDEAWYIQVARIPSFSFLSLAGMLGLALALRNRVPAAGLFTWAFLLLPLPYYLVTVHARFRHPLEPLICILAVYLFQSVTPRRSRS